MQLCLLAASLAAAVNENESPPAIPVRSRSPSKGDTVRCSSTPSGDEALLNGTASLMARIAALYVKHGRRPPERHGFGMTLPGLAAGGGVAASDIELFIRLAQLPVLRTRRRLNVFCIGNAFGYSTLALALSFPHARIAVLDAHETRQGKDRGVSEGTNLTRAIVRSNGLDVRVHVGASPYDVGDVLRHEGMAAAGGSAGEEAPHGAVDVAFIDGAHTDANQWSDWAAIRPHLRPRGASVVILHDVTLSRMYRSLHAILAESSEPARIYRSVNHCNEFGTTILGAAIPSTFGGIIQIPRRAAWVPITAPIYPAQLRQAGGGINVEQLTGDLQLDEGTA